MFIGIVRIIVIQILLLFIKFNSFKCFNGRHIRILQESNGILQLSLFSAWIGKIKLGGL